MAAGVVADGDGHAGEIVRPSDLGIARDVDPARENRVRVPPHAAVLVAGRLVDRPVAGTTHIALARSLFPKELVRTHPDVTARIRVSRSGRSGRRTLEGHDVELVVEPLLIEVPSLDRHPVLQPAV